MFVNASKEEDKEDQLVDWFVSATIKTATGNKQSQQLHFTRPAFATRNVHVAKNVTHISKPAITVLGGILDLTTALYRYSMRVKDMLRT